MRPELRQSFAEQDRRRAAFDRDLARIAVAVGLVLIGLALYFPSWVPWTSR